MSQYDGPVMRYEPPADGIAALVAGVSCGQLAHPGELLRAGSFRALDRRVSAWRCPVCQRPAWGERPDTRPPAGPVAGRAEEHA